MREPQHGRDQSVWTPEHDALLRKLWAEGLSASVTAKRLVADFGVYRSRNAVIGRVHRIGLRKRGYTNSQNRTYQQRRHKKPGPAKKPRAPRFTCEAVKAIQSLPDLEPMRCENGEAFTVLTLPAREACRWPSGDPKDAQFAFCGRESGENVYCAFHMLRAATPLKPRIRHASEQSRADRARYRDSARWAGI